MKKLRQALILNLVVFVLELIAILWMMSGISSGPLSAGRLGMLRYFTVDSNILMGIAALIAAIDGWMVLCGKRKERSSFSFIAKLVGTSGVALTMLVTVGFLTPTTYSRLGLFAMYRGSNFLLHLVNPILSIVTFIGFEKTRGISFMHTFTATVPLILYAIYYTAETIRHTENGVIQRGYDWYGFFVLGLKSVFVILPLIILISWGISLALWKLNRRKG